MVMEKFTIDNEGTYTIQIQDGKAKNQSSLVLIGDGMFTETLKLWNFDSDVEVIFNYSSSNFVTNSFFIHLF